ncbi:MAG TPA: rhomboid family intramembrane serine protease [Dehalococcoidia bacterium]|nr:rhomboid family intramembrane serine protease [Dehalococcoidia bacterium]
MRYSNRGDSLAPVLVIIVLCFMVYIITMVADIFLGHSLIPLLGFRPALLFEQPWTIVTNLFVHGDIWHLLANMLTLYFFGSFLARLVGAGTFLVIYFVGGLMGNIFIFLLPGNPFVPTIGASGAVFALGGTLAVLTPRLRVYVFPIPAPMPLWVAVIGGFVLLTLLTFSLPISWQGHLGGLLSGLVAGLILRRRTPRPFY